MDNRIKNMTHLHWSHSRKSSGTSGTLLKSQQKINGEKFYYKLSNYDIELGIVGHECINEIIVDRLLTILGVEHVSYELIHAIVRIDGEEHKTYICKSKDFKNAGESKCALDIYYQINKNKNEDKYDFCKNRGWSKHIDTMLTIDYIILNRDRHGANLEVLANPKKQTLRIAPLFDHGLSLLCSCRSEEEISKFNVGEDKPCNNFLGSRSTYDNLKYINKQNDVFKNTLKKSDKDLLFKGLEDTISAVHLEKIWQMIWKRYENFCNTK